MLLNGKGVQGHSDVSVGKGGVMGRQQKSSTEHGISSNERGKRTKKESVQFKK